MPFHSQLALGFRLKCSFLHLIPIFLALFPSTTVSNYGNWGIPTGGYTVTEGLFCQPPALVDQFNLSLEEHSTLLLKHPFSCISSTHLPCNVFQVLSHQIRKRSLPHSNSLRVTLLFGFTTHRISNSDISLSASIIPTRLLQSKKKKYSTE